MALRNGVAEYQKNRILTASPAELTLMLYEGAIKFTNIAIMGIEEGNIEKAHNNIQRADRIIEEFQITLDRRYEVSKDFDEVYKYIRMRLLEANVHKDKAILEECLEHMRTMRDTWKEVMRLTNNGQKVS
ncbi:MAG: flagellar export chaperone FliS [Lachnospiraceae bacterium]|nr:flagellar export chaperone FliS [Lachnospiraceae bacterium]